MSILYDNSFWYLIALGLATSLVYRVIIQKKAPAPHPPGPAGYPLIGNTKIPKGHAWKVYREWGEVYGSDIVRINVLGTNMVVLNTLDACVELLDKRSSIYSDRPGNAMTMMELSGWQWVLVVLRYGPLWRDMRRILQPLLHPQFVRRYREMDVRTTHEFLRNLITTPGEFHEHIRYVVARQGLYAAYGVEDPDATRKIIDAMYEALEAVIAAMTPGRFLVDLIPILRYLPEWFPYAGFVKQARVWKEYTDYILHAPFALSKELLASGTLPDDCAAKYALTEESEDNLEAGYREEVVRSALASMYSASIDTSVSVLQTFFLAMVLFPEAQEKARRHIDEACKDRLPDFTDYDALPYVHAMVKEILRWKQVTPLGVVHVSMQDDIYNGYFIPKGTYLLPNISAILQDPSVYPDPDIFSPDRFLRTNESGQLELNPEVRDPEPAIFGFGRRVCPGQYASYESLWLLVACTIASLRISKAKDADGVFITPSDEYTDGFVSLPQRFTCEIAARSPSHAALVAETAIPPIIKLEP